MTDYLNKKKKIKGWKRHKLVQEYAYPILDKPAIQMIEGFVGDDILLSVGAGTGYNESLLDLEVVATDISPPRLGRNVYNFKKEYIHVHKMPAHVAIEKHLYCNALMISWPCYDKPWAAQALKEFLGEKLIYIGEMRGGCNATDEFFDELMDNWKIEKDIRIPTWTAIHDGVMLLTKS